MTAITDIKPDNCKGYPESIAVKGSAREVAEMSDIVVSGKLFFVCFNGNLHVCKSYDLTLITVRSDNFK